jgi:hypothetical protein
MKVLDMMLSKLSSNPISNDVINPPASCLPIFMDQVVRSKLLKEMPTLDDIDVVVWQIRDASPGVQIHRMDATEGQMGASTTSGSNKGKEKVATTGPAPKEGSWSPSRDIGVLTRPSVSPEEKTRLVHDDGSIISEPTLEGQ